jgi:hypothetical protein
MFLNRSDLIKTNPPRLHYGIAVSDIDGDGIFEAVIAGFGGPNRVLKWDGRNLVDLADVSLADAERQAIGVAAGDLDGDGREEIYVLNTDTFSGQKRLADRLFARGDDGWVDLFSIPDNKLNLNLTAGRSVAVVDRLGNGQYGFFVANYGGPMRLYELDEDGRLHDRAPEAGLDHITGGRSVAALPIVSERVDIFAGNENGPNFLFRNNGDGTFTEVASTLSLDDPDEHARGVAFLDLNQDGRFDFALGNWEGPHRLFRQDSSGLWHNVATPAFAAPSRVRTVVAADFDNDGYDEIFFNNIGEPNRLFRAIEGGIIQIPIGDALEPYGLGTGAAIGDLDRDGRLELLIAHGESGMQPLGYYHAPRNDNAWLRVMPLTEHGAPARGAVVTLVEEHRIRRRAIDGGSGYLCQMEPVAHFGLGRDPKVQRIEIVWPDGASGVIESPAPNQLLRAQRV